MPDVYLRTAVSNGDRDALAPHVRNRLQSHHDDRWQDSLRHFSSVASGAARSTLLLQLVAGPEQ